METISGFARILGLKRKAVGLRAPLAMGVLALPLLVLTLPVVAQGQFGYTINNGTVTITAYTGAGGAVSIPSTVDGLPVTSIGAYVYPRNGPMGAFQGCESLTSVTIPCSVANLERYAFMDCLNLTSVYFEGNAPSVGWIEVFDWFVGYTNGVLVAEWDPATVYYLPGTTGWGSTLGGLPTVLWNPRVQTGDASFGVRTNQFGFTITGTSNIVVVVEASTSLANPTWYPLQTNTLTGSTLYFTDPQWTNYPGRFYRVTWPQG